jgi:hypothetical protein
MLLSEGVVNSADAGCFLCESATYYVEKAKTLGLIGSGFFMHIAAVKYDPDLSNPKIKKMSDILNDYYGPDADPDGDGIPNKNAPTPATNRDFNASLRKRLRPEAAKTFIGGNAKCSTRDLLHF